IGLAAPHRDRPEPADVVAERGKPEHLELRDEVHVARRDGAEHGDVDPVHVVDRIDEPALERHALDAVDAGPREDARRPPDIDAAGLPGPIAVRHGYTSERSRISASI